MSTIFDAALTWLSYRPRTEEEMRGYLLKKHFRNDLIEPTLEKLKSYHYIDDARYVENTAEINAGGRRLGRARLARDLRQRGISEENLLALETYISDEAEATNCLYHFEKAAARTEKDPHRRRLPKIAAYLTRRGFARAQYDALLKTLPATDPAPQDFEARFEHYAKLYARKGFTDYEWRARVTRAMLSRGYAIEQIREAVEAFDNGCNA